jgi:hypothetical protein
MFYCDRCAKRKCWPNSLFKSYGKCEICRRLASCNDTPSSYLPEPKEKVK